MPLRPHAALLTAVALLSLSPGTPARAGSSDKSAPQIRPDLFSGMQWRQIGPFRGGRSLTATSIPGDSSTYYFGAASGGVWKSTSGGTAWTPIFDTQSVASIGVVAVAPSNPNVIWVGSGEGCLRGNVSFGDGVFRSLDGGQTWTNLGLRDTRQIAGLVVHPTNPDVALVAALGHAFGPNEERGVFRTADGGKSWQKVLYKDANTGASAIVLDPHNPAIVFASLYQVRRGPYFFESGGPGSGLYKSVDGGLTFRELTGNANGLPKGPFGRIGVTVSPADGSRVYALVEAAEGGLYSSTDGGEHWKRVNEDDRFRQRAWYFSHIFADPVAPETIYTANTGLFKSVDGGKTFELLPAPHGDHHDLWIDPQDPRRMINANDGGVSITRDGGKTWTAQDNQPTAQFYHVTADNRWPYWVYGAQQDNSSVGIKTYSDDGMIGPQDWYPIAAGEAAYIAVDPRDANVIYGGYTGGVIYSDKRSNQGHDVSPWPEDRAGHGAFDAEHRFQWVEPVFLSPHDPDVLYTATQKVLRSRDHGMSWEELSGDLTRNDKSKQQPSGGPITKDNTGVEIYDVVFALAESPVQKGVLWAGSDDGLIHVSRDAGKTWVNVTPKGLPEWSLISIIEASPFDAGTAYVAVERHRLDDLKPYVYKTSDYGKSWSRLDNGLPQNGYVHVVRADPRRRGLLYAGTELGVLVSFDDGQSWQSLQQNLPRVPVHDLLVKDDDLVAATHGRAFWVLDGLGPLREVTADAKDKDVILYAPRPQQRLFIGQVTPKGRPFGDNPPKGAIIDYWFREEPKDEVTLDLTDSQGRLVRHYSSAESKKFEQPPEWPDQAKPVERIPAKAGMNRFVWDLRWEPPVEIPGAFYQGNGPEGPLALAGVYTVKLTAQGKAPLTAQLRIVTDPRVKISDADAQAALDLGLQVRAEIAALHTAVNQLRDVRAQLLVLKKRAGTGAPVQPLLAAAAALEAKMAPVEQRLVQVKLRSSEGNLNFPTQLNEQLDSIRNSVDNVDSAPSQGARAVFAKLKQQTDEQLALWNQLVLRDLPALEQLAGHSRLPALILPAAAGTQAGAETGSGGNAASR